MLTQFTPIIVALSLALTAGPLSGWPPLSSMFERSISDGAGHEPVPRTTPPIRKTPGHIQRGHEARVLSFGP